MNWQYSLIIAIAVAASICVSRVTQARLQLPAFERMAIGLGAFCGAMIGAKVPFLLADWPGLLSGEAWFESGKTITFGMVGGYIGVELAKWAVDVRVKTGDSFVVPVAVAIGIGRFGCFSAGCCHGIETPLPWSVDFGDGVPRHPTQLYEAIFHLASAAMMLILIRKKRFPGQLIKLYFIAYFVYRFWTEFLRPEPSLACGLTMYQWASVAFIPLFVLLWLLDAARSGTEEQGPGARTSAMTEA